MLLRITENTKQKNEILIQLIYVKIVGYTRKNTTLGGNRVGDLVNLEVDIIAKYVERFSQPYRPGITAEFLKEHGFSSG